MKLHTFRSIKKAKKRRSFKRIRPASMAPIKSSIVIAQVTQEGVYFTGQIKDGRGNEISAIRSRFWTDILDWAIIQMASKIKVSTPILSTEINLR